jgi:hypothetical protein
MLRARVLDDGPERQPVDPNVPSAGEQKAPPYWGGAKSLQGVRNPRRETRDNSIDLDGGVDGDCTPGEPPQGKTFPVAPDLGCTERTQGPMVAPAEAPSMPTTLPRPHFTCALPDARARGYAHCGP